MHSNLHSIAVSCGVVYRKNSSHLTKYTKCRASLSGQHKRALWKGHGLRYGATDATAVRCSFGPPKNGHHWGLRCFCTRSTNRKKMKKRKSQPPRCGKGATKVRNLTQNVESQRKKHMHHAVSCRTRRHKKMSETWDELHVALHVKFFRVAAWSHRDKRWPRWWLRVSSSCDVSI